MGIPSSSMKKKGKAWQSQQRPSVESVADPAQGGGLFASPLVMTGVWDGNKKSERRDLMLDTCMGARKTKAAEKNKKQVHGYVPSALVFYG